MCRCVHANHGNKGGPDNRAAGWSANPHGTGSRPPERLDGPGDACACPISQPRYQKGGTTPAKLLEQHPGVYLPTCKEIHYFSLHAEEPARWYAEHYRDARLGQRRGDITPFYLFHPEVPARIRALLPQARMIVLLRDPVERALSQVFHARRHGFETLEVAEALAAEQERLASGNAYSFQKHSYVARSRYLNQLDRYEALFPKRQLLVLKSEDLFNNTAHVWEQIQRFLQLSPIPLPSLPRANAGNGEAGAVADSVRLQLRDALSTTALGVKKRYGFDWGW